VLAKDLTYFAAIAEKGSLAKAALFLSVWQPALTKCVQSLRLNGCLGSKAANPASPSSSAAGIPAALIGEPPMLRASVEDVGLVEYDQVADASKTDVQCQTGIRTPDTDVKRR
jgi:hypothetical protein